MSGKLRMYNVEFGDAFLLYGEGENLLVDLGSIDGGFDFRPVRDSIRQESSDRQLSLLLTHFHKDHWSGLHNQEIGHALPKLKMVYLPDIFKMRAWGKLDVVIRSLLADFLESVLLQQQPQFSLADLLREVLPGLPKEKICFLARGDVFHMGKKSYEVLWPRLNLVDVVGKRDKPLRDFLERIESKLIADGAEYRLWDTLDMMATALLREFALSQDVQYEKVVWDDQRSYEDMYLQARKLAEILANACEHDDGDFHEKIHYYAEALSKDWNRVSLVFHELENKSLLMTGDVLQSTLKHLSNGDYGVPRLKEKYEVMKAPHHGTDSHFCAILPASRFFCISNGEGNRGYQKISEKYEHVYGCRGKKSDIRCTNPRCDFSDRYGCPYFDAHPVQIHYDISW